MKGNSLAIAFSKTSHEGQYIRFASALCLIGIASCDTFGGSAPEQSASWIPDWVLEQPEATPMLVPAQAETKREPAATFIVRFKDAPALDPVYKTFRRDRANAEATYNAWAEDKPALTGLYLSGASYAGELILALPQDDPLGRSAQDVLDALSEMDNLSYAEIDSTAYPSAGASPK